MTSLVLVEVVDQTVTNATRSAIAAALQLSEEVDCLVAGADCSAIATQCQQLSGVCRVFVAEASIYQYPLAENIAALLASVAADYTHIVAGANTFGKNSLPRAAALLGVGQLSDVVAINSADTFVRPIYAGNALATVRSLDPIKLLTVRATAFSPVEQAENKAEVIAIEAVSGNGRSEFVEQVLSDSERPDLTAARVVISGGRALQSSDNFKLLELLADQLNAAIGASRAAVDAGFVPNDYQVGQTGKVVAPELYIAVGISGAIQHVAGMKDSKIIVAINKDEQAPIFKIADYGLVGDLFDLVPALTQELKQALS